MVRCIMIGEEVGRNCWSVLRWVHFRGPDACFGHFGGIRSCTACDATDLITPLIKFRIMHLIDQNNFEHSKN